MATKIRASATNDPARMQETRAIYIIVDLLRYCGARFENNEFCFQGLRYGCSGSDWKNVVGCIGWDRASVAIAKAKAKITKWTEQP